MKEELVHPESAGRVVVDAEDAPSKRGKDRRLERDAEIVRLIRLGQSRKQVREAMEVSGGVVSGVVFRAGLCDSNRRGAARGELSPRAKLTEEKVRFARGNAVVGSREHGIAALARKFGVSSNTLWNACSYVTWAHIP